jgi:elongation of very long chain fatty acids protein 4
MYSYYTLSLLKIRCPWKKYLTQAQLLQFLSVLAYSACSLYCMPKDGNWTQYLAYGIQVFEMSSMFVLFLHFYWKAYSKRNSIQGKFGAKRSPTSASSSLSSTAADSDSDGVAEQESVSSVSSDEQGIVDDHQCS